MKCANPDCDAEGLYLRSGSLYALDFVTASQEAKEDIAITRKIVWLCGKCTTELKVETWRPPGQQLQPRGRASGSSPKILTPGMGPTPALHQLAS
jgi:hypothetical protein